MRQPVAIALALLLVATPVAAAVSVVTIDTDHELAKDSSVRQYQEDGMVSAEILAPSIRLTIAESHDDVGVEGFRADAPWHYLRIEYRETLPIELRLYFPSGYWHPHPQDLSSIGETDVDAELRPVSGTDYSALTVRFQGRSDAVFAIPRTASIVFATRDYGEAFVENRTDLELPTINDRGDPWSYVDESLITGSNTTFAIQTKADRSLTIQFDAGDARERWISVPRCSAKTSSDEPVCRFERDGEHGRIYVLSRVSDPPPVRYKYDAGAVSGIRGISDSIAVTIERALSWVGGLFGGA